MKLHLSEREQLSTYAKQLSLPFNTRWCLFSDGLHDVNDDENEHTDSWKFICHNEGTPSIADIHSHNSSTPSPHAGHQPDDVIQIFN